MDREKKPRAGNAEGNENKVVQNPVSSKINSKQKGKRFELLLASRLREYGAAILTTMELDDFIHIYPEWDNTELIYKKGM